MHETLFSVTLHIKQYSSVKWWCCICSQRPKQLRKGRTIISRQKDNFFYWLWTTHFSVYGLQKRLRNLWQKGIFSFLKYQFSCEEIGILSSGTRWRNWAFKIKLKFFKLKLSAVQIDWSVQCIWSKLKKKLMLFCWTTASIHSLNQQQCPVFICFGMPWFHGLHTL